MNWGKYVFDLIDVSAEEEEYDLPKGEFVMRTGRLFKILMIVAVIVCMGIGWPMYFLLDRAVASLFLIIGGCGALLLPTLLSYRCRVNPQSLKEEYWIVFIRFRKEVLWKDIAFKKIQTKGNRSIRLYDANKKKVFELDGSTVGFHRIVKMANRSSIRTLK